MTIPTIGPPSGAEIASFARHVSVAFGFGDARRAAEWARRCGRANIRVARRRRDVVGGLIHIPMGQWFGGRSVPMTGIAGVCVSPERRADGVASSLMRATVEELHRARVPLSALYPATQPVYRRVGYEQAGLHLTHVLPTRAIDARERNLDVRPIERRDRPALAKLYAASASPMNGMLDRGDYIWRRIWEPGGETVYAYAVCRGSRVEAYTVFSQKVNETTRHYDLALKDLVVTTAEAGRRLLAFFASHRSMADDVRWTSGAADSLLLLPAEQESKVGRCWRWMLRVTHVERALAARGYARGLEAEAHLDVRDDVLPSNGGRFLLSIANGRGTVRRGGHGRVRIDVRGLASLYAGYLPPRALRAAGLLEGPDAELDALAPIFAGPLPSMADFF